MYNVLVVEDYEIIRRQIKRYSVWGEISGFTITHEASNGLEALNILKENEIDLVISDIKMPIVNGIELANEIKELGLCPCVILLSEYTDYDNVRQGFLSGVFDYLSKPITEDNLLRLLERVYLHLDEIRPNIHDLLDVFYPNIEIKSIIEGIEKGDFTVIDTVKRMIKTTFKALCQNHCLSIVIINKAINEITMSVLENNKWIEKFTINSFKRIEAFGIYNEETMVTEASMVIEQLLQLMVNLAYCSEPSIQIREACRYILNHVDDNLSVKDIALELFINKNYLSGIFKEKTKLTLSEYVTLVKMERAKKLIICEKLKNYEVAQQLGYKDVEYFSRVFKKYEGVSPSVYKQKNANNDFFLG